MGDTAWKRAERTIGKLFWEWDEPNPNANKARTGDIKGVGNDAESMRYSIEVKYTSAKSFRVTSEIIDKLEARAKQLGKIPVLAVVFYGGRKAFVIPESAASTLFPLLKEIEECIGENVNQKLAYSLKNLKRAINQVLRELES